MKNEGFDFIAETDTYRNLSIMCIFLSPFLWVMHEYELTGYLWGGEISSTPAIVIGLLAIALRLVAIDRFLRMCRQQDYEVKTP